MSWNPKFLLLILTSTIITYISGLYIEKAQTKQRAKLYLTLSLVSNLSILYFFKYLDFSINTLNTVIHTFNESVGIPNLKILLPVGISFYTFQALSYSMDVYRGKIKAEKHFGIYALYVSFFPQLVAGPIERSEHLLPQFKQKYSFEYDRVTDGLKLMLWGFFKKLVIADRLSLIVNNVYNNVHEFSGVNLTIATLFFGIQIYCDFSGYSDIAIGSAKIMGYDLMDNFKRPYYSKSISEFWRRWHISLSTWFRDYLYIPLGGNRVSKIRFSFNIFVTFLVSGLWHGANWTFVIWGGLHGFYLIFGAKTKDVRTKIADKIGLTSHRRVHKYMQVAVVYLLVHFAWIFFRANNFDDAFYIITNITSGYEKLLSPSGINDTISELGAGKFNLIFALLSIMILEIFHLIQRHGSIRHMLRNRPVYVRWLIYFLLTSSIIMFGKYGNEQFIYFQF